MQTLVVAVVAIMMGVCGCVSGVPGGRGPAPKGGPSSTPQFGVSHWQQLFDAAAPEFLQTSTALSRSSDSWDFYTLAYSIDAFTAMYEATGERRYVEDALDLVESVIASARPSRTLTGSRFDDDFMGWTSAQPEADEGEVALYESYCWRYVVRLLRVLSASPLADDPSVIRRYGDVLAFSERDIFDKWFTRGANEYVFRSRTHMASHWAYIALDLAQVTADPSRRDRYLAVVRQVNDAMPNYAASLRQQLQPSPMDPSAYLWSSHWDDTNDEPQDVAHGNGDIAYVVEARDLNAGWSEAEIQGFTRTLTSIVLRQDDQFPEYVDGSGTGTGWISDGFVKLGRFDPAVQAVLEAHQVQNQQYYAAMAVNAAKLGLRE